MPDISRLQELCNILDIRFEELVGETSKQSETVKKLMSDKETEVSLEDIIPIAPLIDPEKIEKKAEEAIDSNREISFSTLIELAPFLDKETLDGIIDKAIVKENLDTKNVVGLAPFLSKDTLMKIAGYMLSHGQERRLIAIAPFLGNRILSNIVKTASFTKETPNDSCIDLDELDEEDIEELALQALSEGKNIEVFLDYLDEDALKNLLLQATGK